MFSPRQPHRRAFAQGFLYNKYCYPRCPSTCSASLEGDIQTYVSLELLGCLVPAFDWSLLLIDPLVGGYCHTVVKSTVISDPLLDHQRNRLPISLPTAQQRTYVSFCLNSSSFDLTQGVFSVQPFNLAIEYGVWRFM